MRKNKVVIQKLVIIFVSLATIGVFDVWLFMPKNSSPTNSQKPVEQSTGLVNNQLANESTEQIPQPEQPAEFPQTSNQEEEIVAEIKPSVNFDVSFASQAPLGKWDDLHNESCEEAALIMAKYWLDKKELTPEIMEKEILAMVDWQIKNWGGHYDLNVENVVRLGQDYLGLQKIYYTQINSINDVKYELSKDNLVIVPTAGRLLKNQYYRQPGPVYHALVVKGYGGEKIITNDPGTKRGKDFAYAYQNFLDSIHNWPFELGEKENLSKDEKAVEILKGGKMMIVVEK